MGKQVDKNRADEAQYAILSTQNNGNIEKLNLYNIIDWCNTQHYKLSHIFKKHILYTQF